MTLLPATQQNIIASGIKNHFYMHKNTVDIRNFTHTQIWHIMRKQSKKKAGISRSPMCSLFLLKLVPFYISPWLKIRSNQPPHKILIGSESPPSFHSTVEPSLPIFNSPSKILPTPSLILKMATLPNGKATSSWLAFYKIIKHFRI